MGNRVFSAKECEQRFRDTCSCDYGLIRNDVVGLQMGRFHDEITHEVKRYDVIDRKMVVVADASGKLLVEDASYG
tara:strand:+ start:527 stop:751 length:225 start_codon:yes stop_codon:yes gene_type:complete